MKASGGILLSHPTGSTFVRQALKSLADAGRLAGFRTAFGFPESSALLRLPLPKPLRAELCRRSYALPPALVRAHPLRDAGRLLAQKLGFASLVRHESGPFCVDAVYAALDAAVARELRRRPDCGAAAVYAYEDGCLRTFAAAREAGMRCLYELPIAYGPFSRQLLDEEAERLPQWEPTLVGTRDSAEKLERKEREAAAADAIFCPSAFVRDSLPAELRNGKPIHIVPYGAPAPVTLEAPHARHDAPVLRVLFAGSMTQRKGLADLFTAMRLLNRRDIELVVLGSPVAPPAFYREQFHGFIHEGPRPNSAVLALMDTCHVLVLPSIVEGRANVQLEALSRGLPLVVTPNAGGDDLIAEGETGFLVPPRQPEAIAEKLAWLAEHRDALAEMRKAALDCAARNSWNSYRQRLLAAILSSLPE